MEIIWRVSAGRGKGENWGKVRGLRSIIGRNKIDRERNSIGNGEAKELTCTTHGFEVRGELLEGRMYWAEGDKGAGNWDNCNIIISKIYFKILKKR